MTALLRPDQHRSRGGPEMGKLIRASVVGLATDASMVVVRFRNPMKLAVAKPGDESWTVVDNETLYSTLHFAGRFYCTDYRGVMVLTTSSDQRPPRLQAVVEWTKSFFFQGARPSPGGQWRGVDAGAPNAMPG
uniref:KIB1-4 beta-propeller domain-containing protein n=1 Tax=Triticum urartu TaxID=4572 RepID=A0A8R7VJR5_TRIUA